MMEKKKNVDECELKLVYEKKEGGGKNKEVKINNDIEEYVDEKSDEMNDVGKKMEKIEKKEGVVKGIME